MVKKRLSRPRRATSKLSDMELAANLHNKVPKEFAIASEKYQNGKSRAIYGGESIHYTINSYDTMLIEEQLFKIPGTEKGVVGINKGNVPWAQPLQHYQESYQWVQYVRFLWFQHSTHLGASVFVVRVRAWCWQWAWLARRLDQGIWLDCKGKAK